MSAPWGDLPAPLDVVYCNFPEQLIGPDQAVEPGPKPRVALVLEIDESSEPPLIHVAYGTTKRTRSLMSGEFQISPSDSVFVQTGCTDETKFDLRRSVWLMYDDVWFKAKPGSNQSTPILGRIDISNIEIKKRLMAAHKASIDSPPKKPQPGLKQP